MDVIRLPNGNLLVPESATAAEEAVIGEAYVEIDPSDPDYSRLAEVALTQEQVDRRRDRWREGDAELRRQFLDFLASRGAPGQPEAADPGSG
jgi:post-segregation antitoxin (ccd killing protein)